MIGKERAVRVRDKEEQFKVNINKRRALHKLVVSVQR